MIELRWQQDGDGHEDSPITLTLQYRENSEAFGMPVGVWTAWKDVPVVDRQGHVLGYGGGIKT